MSDLKLLKQRIYNDDRVEDILDRLGCRNIHKEGDLVVASLPNGDNKRSCQVRYNESLSSFIRSKGVSGDIYAIVSYIKFGCATQSEIDNNLSVAKMWLIDEFGYHDVLDKNKKPGKDYNYWLKNLKKLRKKRAQLDSITPNRPLTENTKDFYYMIPYKSWKLEGISYDTQIEWEVGFDWDSKRIITLVRNVNGELIGVKGRAMTEDDERKYMYIEKMNKSIEIFGLHKTLSYVLDKKEAILFEGYKSVMKAWQYDYKNCGSIEGDDISPAQVALIKSFGLDIKVTLCYDKDKTPKEIIEQAKKFTNRKVFIVYDDDDLLSGKMASVDDGETTWETLYSNKYTLEQFEKKFPQNK